MASGGTPSSDRVFIFRLQTLIVDGGTLVLRKIFDQKLPNEPLNVFLANEQTSIKSLRRSKTITEPQYDLFYPKSGQHPKSSDFDITLIICLLRNLKSLGLNNKYKWSATPQPADTSVEADLCRLKRFRNEVSHLASLEIQPSEFQTKWTDIEQVLLRLSSTVPNPDPNLKQTIDGYKSDPLDHAEEKRIQNVIRQWREMETGLEIEIDIIKKDVKEVNKVVKDVAKDVSENIIEVKELKSQFTKEFQELKTDVKKLVESDQRGQNQQGILQNLTSWGESGSYKDLENDMVLLYRRQHSHFKLSPLLADDLPLLQLYVMPDILSLKVERGRDSVKIEKTLVTSFSKMFFKEDKMYNEVYVTADAGLGKTAFSKRLALAWCHAKEPLDHDKKYFTRDEIEDISKFRFVFLLLLRDNSSGCDIDDLILKQILSQLPKTHRYSLKYLEDILAKETCLVILDGLDEWSHPSNSCNKGRSAIPHRKARRCTVVLTTTRPWKLSVIGLGSSQIDQKLEITGLNLESANTLKRSVLSYWSKEKDENKFRTYEDVTAFTKAVKDKHISDMEAIPILLTNLLFLWYYKKDIRLSQYELYCYIVEILLSKTVKPHEKSSIVEYSLGDVPKCFSKLENCRQFYQRLTCLGHLAFKTLFRDTREKTKLVFDSSLAKKYLDEHFFFFLSTGIITQNEIPETSFLENVSKVSFASKSMQEFFAALYIRSTPHQTSVPEIMLSNCKCVKDIIEMLKVLLFLSRLDVNTSSSISHELVKIINEDEITREYRSTLTLFYKTDVLKTFQDMCVSCCKELLHDTEVIVCLNDVFIDRSCEQEQYREHLRQVTARNNQNIISLNIDMPCVPFSNAQEVIKYFALYDMENIEKLHYNGKYEDRDILPLLNMSVKSLYLWCRWSSWSVLLYEKVTSLQKLEAIFIHGFDMSHEQLILLCEYISQRHCMREIELWDLRCTDHDFCPRCSLDLSQHSQLREITLNGIYVSELNISMSSLEKCHLRHLSNPDLVLRFINGGSAGNKVIAFECRYVKSSAAMETVQQTLPLFVHVKDLLLWFINLSTRDLLTSEMVNIESIKLWDVTMPASVLRNIVTVLQTLTQTVTTVAVDIQDCTITPENEFVTVREEIKQSSMLTVMVENESKSGKNLWFETKDGD